MNLTLARRPVTLTRFILVFLISLSLQGGDPIHDERPDMAPAETRATATSPARTWTRGAFSSVQVNVDGDGNNIVGDAANEPSIAASPDHMQLVAGWRQFDAVSSNFRQAGFAWSHDGGLTWTFPGSLDAGVFRSDPVLASDGEGNFYYNGLGVDSDFFCTVWKSTNGGIDWGPGVSAHGGDKQWMEIDKSGGMGDGHIYSNWTRAFSSCNGDWTVSFDGGQSFEDCIGIPGTPRFGTIAIDREGVVYMGGATWRIAKSTTLRNPDLPPAFDFTQSVDMGGAVASSAGPNPGGLLGQVYVGVDKTEGPRSGFVYMVSTVDPPNGDPADVMFVRSEDGGLTWTPPMRLNTDPLGSWQWFAMMDVAPNGRIDVLWNDTRNAKPGSFDSELYYIFSEDGGLSWSKETPVSPAFDPHLGWPQQNKIGDYNDLTSMNAGVDLIYCATFNGEQDVYFLRIPHETCPLDLNGDGEVSETDWRSAAEAWGTSGPGDIDDSGLVDLRDLIAILNSQGPCP